MIAIIGAGPAGSQTAFCLAKAGYDVCVFEDHKIVGDPIQCTGVLTSTVSDILPPSKEYFVNEINRIEVIAPDDSKTELKLKRKEYIYDRTKFDQYLANRAKDAGATILAEHRFIDYSQKDKMIKVRHQGEIKDFKIEKLIGADGPSSPVAKASGLYGERRFFIGAQAVVELKNDPEVYRTYFGSVCPHLFAWAVPEDENKIRLGLADRKNPNLLFKALMKRIGVEKILEWQGGLIPIYNPKVKTQSSDGNVFLVGDAATQVKATTAGGIIQAMTAAQIAAKCIIDGTNYDAQWRKTLGKELWLHLMIRQMLDKFKDKDYNELVRILNRPNVKKVLESQSRDRPMSLVSRLFLSYPMIAKFGLRAIF